MRGQYCEDLTNRRRVLPGHAGGPVGVVPGDRLGVLLGHLPRHSPRRLPLRHQTDPQPHVVQTLQQAVNSDIYIYIEISTVYISKYLALLDI